MDTLCEKPPEILHEVALVDDQTIIPELPEGIDVGLVETVTVGAGVVMVGAVPMFTTVAGGVMVATTAGDTVCDTVQSPLPAGITVPTTERVTPHQAEL